MSSFSRSLSFGRFGDEVAAGWRELGDAVARSLPAFLRRTLALDRRRLVIDLVGDAGEARLVTDVGHAGAAVSFANVAADDAVRALRGLAAQPLDEIVLRLPAETVLVTDVKLPRTAARDLNEVLAFELERTLPFPREVARYDHAVVAADGQGLQVRLHVATRAEIDGALKRIEPWGIAVDRITGEAGTPDFSATSQRVNLLPVERRPPPRAGIASRLAWALALLVIVAALASPFIHLRAERAALERANALGNGTGGNAADDRARRAAVAKFADPPVVVMLDELTRLLPDEASLVQFNWSDRRIEIEGNARSAAALVARLEGSPLFGAVEFLTPVVREPVSGAERFHFGIALKGRAVAPRPGR